MLEDNPSAEAAQARACQAHRMEIVGQLAGGVVHDFNNILTVIAGTIEVLAEAVADRPELASIARLIDEAATRGGSLTSHLLAFARSQPSRPRAVDVNVLLVEAARLLRPTLGEQIEIHSVLAADVPRAWADPSQLMTAMLDLAIAARDATPGGGNLTFESRSAKFRESPAGSEVSVADHVAIAVSVSGPGISADHRDRTFADLGKVKAFASQAGGHIEVRREAGRAASVEIYLPGAAGFASPPEKNFAKTEIERGDEAVLIVEDDLLVRKYVVSQVQGLGYRTLAAGNASEALAIIDAGEDIDLLFTDVMMPGSINGRQLAIEASNRRPSLRVLFTSGYSENTLAGDGYLDAGVLMLAKPYRKLDLARMIRTALAV